jgi:hypothetical protein
MGHGRREERSRRRVSVRGSPPAIDRAGHGAPPSSAPHDVLRHPPACLGHTTMYTHRTRGGGREGEVCSAGQGVAGICLRRMGRVCPLLQATGRWSRGGAEAWARTYVAVPACNRHDSTHPPHRCALPCLLLAAGCWSLRLRFISG